MKDYAERASNYIGKHARYYARGIPPTGGKSAVEYRGAVFVSNDTYDLRLQLQVEMVKKERMCNGVSNEQIPRCG